MGCRDLNYSLKHFKLFNINKKRLLRISGVLLYGFRG